MRAERHYGNRVGQYFAERPSTLFGMLEEAASRNPEGEAIVSGKTRLRWGELVGLAETKARRLAGRGIRRGDRVVMLMAYDAEFVLTLFALFRLGAIAVPVSIRSSQAEVAFIAGNTGAKLVLHDPSTASLAPPASADCLIADHDTLSDEAGLPDPKEVADEEDVAVILHTSGTTGKPKGAMLTHLALIHAAIYYKAAFGLTSEDRVVSAVPLSHVTGIAALTMAAIHAGATLVIMSGFKAAAFLDTAEAEGMTATVMVPAMYNLCLMQPDFRQRDLGRWRVAAYGGAPMPEPTIRALAEAIPGLRFANCYGSTEVVVAQLMTPPEQALAKLHCVGCALPGTRALIVNDEGKEVATGEVGEIWLGGPNVTPGYWNDPAATAAAFVDGYWRSGDIGVMDSEGFVQVLDRAKDMINRGGLKIYSAELENVVTAHPAVVEAAAVARACPVLGERVHLVVTAREPVPEADLAQWCKATLSDYKVPDSFDISQRPLPRNSNGKVDKRALREGLQPWTRA